MLEISSIANSTSVVVNLPSCSAREEKLTPQFVIKASSAHSWAAKEQIVLLHLTWLYAIALDLIFRHKREPSVIQRFFLSQSADTWSDIVGVVLTEEGSIDHGSTLDRNLNDLPFFHKKGVSVVLKVVDAQQGNEPPAAFYKTGPHLASARMVRRGNAVRLTIH